MGIRVAIHRTAGFFDLARQRPLSARRAKTRCDTDRDRHTCAHEAESGRLETSAQIVLNCSNGWRHALQYRTLRHGVGPKRFSSFVSVEPQYGQRKPRWSATS